MAMFNSFLMLFVGLPEGSFSDQIHQGIYTALLKKSGHHVLLGLNSSTFGAFAVNALTFGASKVGGICWNG